MYVHKGFITHALFANNTPGVVARIGEMSPQSLTYSREKGIYSSATNAPNLTLISFTSTQNDQMIVVPEPIQSQILTIGRYVYDLTLSGQTILDVNQLLEQLLTQMAGQADNFESGEMITDGEHSMPEWLAWRYVSESPFSSNSIKVWFIDDSFKVQFDDFEIHVIPPTDTLDNFFGTGASVDLMLQAIDASENTDRIQAAKDGYPETIIRTFIFDYHDPMNVNHRTPSNWSVLIYGIAGDNIDAVKDALIQFILTHSTHTRSEWVEIFPDIFKRTEFIFVPLWDQLAIPNRALQVGIYSPIAQLPYALSLTKQIVSDYPSSHIDLYLALLCNLYKSLSVTCIAGPDNRDALFQLVDVFPDYLLVPTDSTDFGRMSQLTQGFAVLITTMMQVAETMTIFSTIPQGMSKVVRNGILYLVKNYHNINYLVMAKRAYLPPPPV